MKPADRLQDAQFISLEEVAKHNTADDGWLVIDHAVYNVTNFVRRHPGGKVILTSLGKKDSTDVFNAFHRRDDNGIIKRLRAFHIGYLDSTAPENEYQQFTREYRELEKRFQEMGLFEADLNYFLLKFTLAVALLPICYLLLAHFPSEVWSVFLAGVLCATFWQQMGFLAHDSLHNGIFRDTHANAEAGWVTATLGFGISSHHWKDEHNVHHAITNQVHEDLQFTYLPVWLLDEKELLVGKGRNINMLARSLIHIQHFTFIPLSMFIGRINLYVLTILYCLGYDTKRGERKPVDWVDFLGLCLHFLWFAKLLSLVEGAWLRVFFVVVSYTFVGVLHVQLSLSHIGADMFVGHEQEDLEFFRFQMQSTRDIDSNRWTHWFHGGLQYQIEHHLFPRMPRHHLQTIQPHIRKLCNKYHLPYESTSLWKAIKDVHIHMKEKSKFV